jgi:hypothetical protein
MLKVDLLMSAARRRRNGRVLVAVAITALAWGAAGTLAAQDEQSRSERLLQERVDEAHRREAEVLVRLADDARAGRVAADFAIEWRNDFLKAQPGTFVPFTVSIARAGLDATHALMYVRAVRVGTPGVAAVSQGAAAAEDGRFAFDAIFPVPLSAPAGEPFRISRGFAVAPGEYDVYVTVRERPADPLSSRPGRLKAAVLKRTLSVPDYWTGELSTSTVMLADRIEVLRQPLGPDESLERPYAIGLNDVQIATSSRFRKNRELIVVFVVYNPMVTADRRFDLQVDYHLFHRLPPGAPPGSPAPEGAPPAREGERYVTRTEPQRFNPSVLGPRVDPGAGHPVLAGQGILLSSFQEGDYRLGITITDLLSRKTLTRDVTFTVTGS